MLFMRPRNIDASRVRHTFRSLEDLFGSDPSRLETGVYRVDHGLPIFVDWRNRGQKSLVVTFSAATSKAADTLPVFSGAGVTKDLECNVLMISDPTMLLDQETTIAWYAGNSYQPNLQDDLAQLIAHFAQGGRVILLGGSGGGYAALVEQSKLSDATSVVFNPSTRITGRPVFKTYLEKMWQTKDPSDLPSSLILNLVEVYENPVEGEVYYVQNSFDQNFVRNYFWPLAEAVHEENKFFFMTPFYAKGHVPLSGESISSMLKILLSSSGWDERRMRLASLRLTGRANLRNQTLE